MRPLASVSLHNRARTGLDMNNTGRMDLREVGFTMPRFRSLAVSTAAIRKSDYRYEAWLASTLNAVGFY